MRITHGRGVDVILDAVGGSTTRKNYRCLAPLGHLWDHEELIPDVLGELLDMWSAAVIEPVIDSTHSFQDAADAHTQLEQSRNFGKVLLVPPK